MILSQTRATEKATCSVGGSGLFLMSGRDCWQASQAQAYHSATPCNCLETLDRGLHTTCSLSHR